MAKIPTEQNMLYRKLKGTASVRTSDRLVVVNLIGGFRFEKWQFIVHRKIDEPKMFTVTEVSTGYALCSADTLQQVINDSYRLLSKVRYKLPLKVMSIISERGVSLTSSFVLEDDSLLLISSCLLL